MISDEQQLELNEKLYTASYKNQPDNISELVKQGAQVNSLAQGGRSPLVEACSYGALEAVIVLLELGADPNFRSLYNRNPLMLTIGEVFIENKNRHFEIAKLLIEAGININMVNQWGDSALHYAIKNNNAFEFVELLLIHHADPNLLNSDKKSPIIMAIDKPKVFDILLKYKAEFDIKLINNLLAKKTCDIKQAITASLLNNGISFQTIFAQVENKLDYLLDLEEYFSGSAYDEFIQKYINEFKEELNIQDAEGKTMLMKFVQEDNFHKVKKLIQLGADMNIRDKEGKTALFYANRYHEKDTMARYLIESGADINVILSDGSTILIRALEAAQAKNDLNFVKFLLQNKLTTEVINSMVVKNISMIYMLLNNSTPGGLTKYTALFYLVICINNIDRNSDYLDECLQILDLLLVYNADPSIRCDSNKTVFNICQDKQASSLLRNNILQGHGLQNIAKFFNDWFKKQKINSDLVDITHVLKSFLIEELNCDVTQLKRFPELKQLLADKYSYSFYEKNISNFGSSKFGKFSQDNTMAKNNNANDTNISNESMPGNASQTENEIIVQNQGSRI